jgi:glycosyltransferase involved in cell wall biosynthesis
LSPHPHCLPESVPASGPRISVVIPTYNRRSLVADAIDSCFEGNVAPRMLEIIVVDDGSTDGTASVLRSFENRIRCIPLAANLGRNRARNIGLSAACGRYVKFLDSDDVLEPASLGIELAAAEGAGADIVVGGWRTIELNADRSARSAKVFEAPNMEPVVDSLLDGRAVPTSGALYSRALIRDQRWDEELRKLDDWDWFIRAALRASRIVRVDAVSYSWRQHPDQGVRAESMLRNAREHHVILRKLEAALAAEGTLTDARKRRLAQYFYKEMRVLSLYDRQGFDWSVRHLHELDPGFVPRDEERQRWMRLACRILGVRRTLLFHSAAKKLIKPSAVDFGVADR